MSGRTARGAYIAREAPSEQEMTQPGDRLQPLSSSAGALSSGLPLQPGLGRRV